MMQLRDMCMSYTCKLNDKTVLSQIMLQHLLKQIATITCFLIKLNGEW